MTAQEKWNTLEDGAAALVNKARLWGGTAETEQEWTFLIGAALALALAVHDEACGLCMMVRDNPGLERCRLRAEIEALGDADSR